MRLIFAELNPADVLNLTSPRWIPEISLRWCGRLPWHDAAYDRLRDKIEKRYIAEFNRANGHFDRLLRNVAAEGIRNPVMISSGCLICRRPEEIPPAWRNRRPLLVSEYLGGSRLWAAQRLGLAVPAIISDCDHAVSGRILRDLDEVAACFTDRPASIKYHSSQAVLVGDLPFVHLPIGRRIDVAEQSRIRQRIVFSIRMMVDDWLRENENSEVA